jgi:glycosyltransferase involved in cell wall biosynthesis
MANILILNSTVPYPPQHSGNTVRVYHLSQALARHHSLFGAAFGDPDRRFRALQDTGLYQDLLLLPERSDLRRRVARGFNFMSGYLDRIARPEYFDTTLGALRGFVNKHRIDLMISHTLPITQYAEAIPEVAHIVDLIDSHTLAAERHYSQMKQSLDWPQKVRHLTRIYRSRHRERFVTGHFPLITTVSPIDQACLAALNRSADIHVVPNGVSPQLLEERHVDDEIANAIAFSGTLDFPPNSTAVYYFYESVFLPYLKDRGITWYIVGRNPEPRMLRMAEEHDHIVVTGEVEDLFGLIARMPIVINPMRMGGGLKNKVLEGMALERLVISNRLGIESVEASPDVHYVEAETPQEFASAILLYLGQREGRARIGQAGRRLILDRYTWTRAADSYLRLISRALAPGNGRALAGTG